MVPRGTVFAGFFLVGLGFGSCCKLESGGKIRTTSDIPVSSSNLKETVSFLAAGVARSVDHTDRLARAANFIEDRFKQSGYFPQRLSFQAEDHTYQNILAVLNTDKSPVIVVGAHYDVCGDQPGADDNASGVAGLLELARILKPSEKEIPYQIQFVAYANEEPPYFRTEHMGSFHHAKSLWDSGTAVKLIICLEMIGYFSDEKKSQSYPSFFMKWFYPTRGNYAAVVSEFGHGRYLTGIARAIKSQGLHSRTLSAPAFVPGIDFSDHMNYWKFGYKAVMVTDTAFYRNPNYHQPTDTPNTLDYDRMALVVKGVAAYLLALK